MMPPVTRRRTLAAAAGLLTGRETLSQGTDFTILSHRVHQQVATNTQRPGGDVTEDFVRRTGRRIAWVTMDNGPLHDRLQRELTLQETSLDLVYVLNTAISSRLLRLLEPLDPLMAAEPVEDFADIAPRLSRSVMLEGSLRAVPIRQATVALFWNEALFAERGVTAPPTTLEELTDIAARLTYRRADGTPVNGFAYQGNSHFNNLTMAFAFDAPLLDDDLRLLPNEAGMRAMFELQRSLFQRGVLPRNFAAISQDDVFTMIQQGRVAMALAIAGRFADFNDPSRSRFPGQIRINPMVAAAGVRDRVPLVATSDFWSVAIPRNARNKPLAWSLIRDLTGRQGTLRQALNGNGPVRSSVYSDPRLTELVPSAVVEAQLLPHVRPPLPIFGRAQQAADAMMQATQAATIGLSSPADALAELKRRVAPLLVD